ncbi:MAG: L-2-hydroxyglutarate oxidase [Thermoplasmata archaeon]
MVRPVVVVGGGILGLTVARAVLRRWPGTPLLLLEKERTVAVHQTGHNSGVIHSGVYYRPGSLKANLCVRGRAMMLEYLREEGIPFRLCGKVVVASRPSELPALEELERRARANGVPDVARLDPAGIRAIEPEAVGVAGLHVPGTGIVDYAEVARRLAVDVERRGGVVRLGEEVTGLRSGPEGPEVRSAGRVTPARYVINAAGLQADRLAQAAGLALPGRIVPFRGEYYLLRPQARSLVRGLIYPVPDPEMPFLGVHLTSRIGGDVEAGPNAVLAGAREGYRWSTVRPDELVETLATPGFVPMVRRFGRAALYEAYRSLNPRAFLRDLQRLVPALTEEDLRPGGAGVRAQALLPDGRLADDFLLVPGDRALHVLNAPSPAATSSLAIAEYLVDRVPLGPTGAIAG